MTALTTPALTTVARAETCHYIGTTSYNGRLVATVTTTQSINRLEIDARLQLDATPWHLWPVQYLVQERTTWTQGRLTSAAINGRYTSNGTISRQYWDLFTPTPTALIAERIQVKRQADLLRRNPAFARYWDPATFGQPWEQTFRVANSDRRPDLDLPTSQMPDGLRTPLALALYWSRATLPNPLPLFLPGWKKDARLTATITRAGPPTTLTVSHPNLAPGSTATIQFTPTHTLTLTAQTPYGTGQATIIQTTCTP